MSQAIYRKYRPQTFADVINQYHITTILKNQIISDTVAHAYVFAGPRGIGKTTIARLLAKAVNCENRQPDEGEPCGTCQHCEEMNQSRALDVIEIDAASHTGVENVRENIIEAVRFSPSKARFKVFIIDEVHMLSTSAFNALLKTLEEPPSHAIFILATTELHKIPATILSRCQRFDFHRIASEDMIKRLASLAKGEGIKVDDDVFEAIARLSEGCMRDAESLLGQVFALGEKVITKDEASIILPVTNTATIVELMDAVVRTDAKSVVEILNIFVDQGGSIKNLTDELIDFARTMMLVALEGPYHDHYDRTTMDKLRMFNKIFSIASSINLLDELLKVKARPRYDALPQLPLELALIDACGSDGVIESPKQKLQIPTEVVVEKVIEKEAPVEKNRSEESVTVQEMQEKWKRCCEAVGKVSIALPMVLNTAKPTKIIGQEVIIEFDKKFHLETFNKPQNIKILQDAIRSILQVTLNITPIYAHQENDEALSDLASAFGGEVVG